MVYLLWLRLFALLVVAGGHLAALPQPSSSLEAQWTAFKSEFNKTYPNPAENDRRKLIFLQNLAEIEQHNAEYNLSDPNAPHYKLGINQFSDWSAEEFASRMYGTFRPANFTPTLVEPPEFSPQSLKAFPEELDLRNEGFVTDVKNQDGCGSCYAFSAVGALEGQAFRVTKKLVSLSAQNLVDCSKTFGNNGCGGGWLEESFEYVKWNGIATEEDYPYEDKKGLCRLDRKYNLPDLVGHGTVQGESGLIRALNNIGPVSFGYFVSDKFGKLKDEGIFNLDPQCENNKGINHAMLLVGYGVQDGQKYWLVKNSWGTWWSDSGYVKILRGKNLCNIESYGYYPVLADVD